MHFCWLQQRRYGTFRPARANTKSRATQWAFTSKKKVVLSRGGSGTLAYKRRTNIAVEKKVPAFFCCLLEKMLPKGCLRRVGVRRCLKALSARQIATGFCQQIALQLELMRKAIRVTLTIGYTNEGIPANDKCLKRSSLLVC
ncbi:hypothetical protein NPIL_348471 [Nephila pilipes]|uniref:Uncharacterized protein n=1 Tax=Nephila pilipes TaxID=299642 RepID=A0A8X6TVN3_NEPPI|nr:hypothetical protein NPIL_348471 [Nephila pilipes]